VAVHVNPRKGDIGTPIELTITSDGSTAVDISTATTKQITLQSPTGTETTYTASFTNTGTDGKLRYTTVATTNLNAVGPWLAEAYIVTPSGAWHSSILRFRVDPTLADV